MTSPNKAVLYIVQQIVTSQARRKIVVLRTFFAILAACLTDKMTVGPPIHIETCVNGVFVHKFFPYRKYHWGTANLWGRVPPPLGDATTVGTFCSSFRVRVSDGLKEE